MATPLPPQSDPPAIEVSDLSKRYGARWAVARLSFSLPRGTSLLLTGHNGSGKTTLLRVIATALRPTRGAVRVFGYDASSERDEVRRRVGLLSHASYLYDDLSAEQNLLLFARLLGLPAPSDEVRRMLDRVGLSARSHSSVRQFSAGMRKRLAIARLLMKAPALALLDEPFGELDPAGITDMEATITELQKRGTTVVLATHLIEQGEALTQRRLHLSQGQGVLS